ncbi:T9SS type A sorting domain-containing protein [Reichenbachiella sp. MSK19-1]|uniref:T9SS type A sorting domain-containing protein n=1 Tax=Reichenbachiella sp. MSK19-1 TaxID=1897631 RepID=UPI000E6D01B5|nr:T9SS type A sorting domain-containing protein [Reichenbachiella sp. MSK19-1]RJE73144.1 hypothetical protein BGP76_04175 [Reichenbachiella sp. MSK19-1]
MILKPKLLCILLFTFLTHVSFAQSNRYVDGTGSDTANDCSDPNAPCATINHAVGQSSTNDIINLSEGTFAAADISTRVTLSGMGSGTIVQTLDLSAATSGTDLLTIENLVISGGSSPGIDIQTSYVHIENITANGYSRNVQIQNTSSVSNITINNCNLNNATGTGLLVNINGVGSAVDGLTVLNTSMDDSRFGFYSQMGTNTNVGNYLTNVLFRNCSFSNNTDKGVYCENLDHATFENISIINSGTRSDNAYNNGIDINLKWQTYSDITIRNSRIMDCGAIGPNDIDTAPENRRTTAVTIKARTDAGSYSGSPASLNNVTLDGVIIDGLVGDLRFGEMGKTDNTGIDMSSVSISHCSFANDDVYALVNEENTNTLTLTHNYWGESAVSISNYGSGAATSQSDALTHEIVDDADNSYSNLAAAILNASSSATIQNLPAGTISGTTILDKELTLVAPGAGLLDDTYRTTFENLTLSGENLTLGGDINISGVLSMDASDGVDIDDYNIMISGSISSTGRIDGSTTGGLYLWGTGDIGSLTTTGTFERVVLNRNGTTTLSTPMSTNYLLLEKGLVDATGSSLIFKGNTALPGNTNAYVIGEFIHQVLGAHTGNKLFFPIGETDYHPMTIEGIDQTNDVLYNADFIEADPSNLSTLFALTGLLDRMISENYWTVTPSTPGNITQVDRVLLSYNSTDQVSDPNNLQVAQLQTIAAVNYWINLGGLLGYSGFPLLNPIQTYLGSFTYGAMAGGTNFTELLTIYVDATLGLDTNLGTLASPKKTLASAYALSQVGGGSTLNIAAGTYDESIEIHNDITLTGTGDPNATAISLYADITVTGFTADEVTVGDGGSIQDGLDLVSSGGTVTVEEGTYNESLTISKPTTLNGANTGIPANDPRNPESIIEPASNAVAITVAATDVTINGFQIGTNSTASNATTGIANDSYADFSVLNNIIYANSAGVNLANVSSGIVDISYNDIEMLDFEDQTNLTNPSYGLFLYGLNGTVDAEATNNDIIGASYGIWVYNAYNTADNLLLSNSTMTGCTKGIEISNTDLTNFEPSEVQIEHITMSAFSGVSESDGLVQPDTQAGIYLFAKGDASADITDDLFVNIDSVDISGVSNGAGLSSSGDFSAIYLADFQQTGPFDGSDDDEIGITATLSNSNLHDNLNRAVYVRGNNADLTISRTDFTNNGSDPYGTGGNNGYNIQVRSYASCQVNESNLINPATQAGAFGFEGLGKQDANCDLTVSNSYFDQNGNGNLAISSGIDLSTNYFNSIDETEIEGWVGSNNDFTPYLADGTDTETDTDGFQPDDSHYYITLLGVQTGGTLRKQEAHDVAIDGGQLTLNSGSYTGTHTITKDLTVNIGSATTIGGIIMNGTGKTLTLAGDVLINDGVTLTDGIVHQSSGTMTFGNSANDISETADSHILGRISTLPRAVGTASITMFCTTIDAGTDDLGNVTIARTTGTDGIIDTYGNTSISCYWEIDTDNQPASGRNVSFCWIPNHDNSKDLTQISLFKDGGAGWGKFSGDYDVSAMDPRIISSTTTSFSDWTAAQEDEPLPVELTDFSAYAEVDHVQLSWETASEINSDYFSIERSTDGTNFQSIGKVSSHHQSNEINRYHLKDYPLSAATYYYRLKAVDYDGSFEYSKTISIDYLSGSIISVSPNPTTGLLTIETTQKINRIEVYTLSGNKKHKAVNQNYINIQSLASGIYLVKINTDTQSEVIKVIKN